MHYLLTNLILPFEQVHLTTYPMSCWILWLHSSPIFIMWTCSTQVVRWVVQFGWCPLCCSFQRWPCLWQEAICFTCGKYGWGLGPFSLSHSSFPLGGVPTWLKYCWPGLDTLTLNSIKSSCKHVHLYFNHEPRRQVKCRDGDHFSKEWVFIGINTSM